MKEWSKGQCSEGDNDASEVILILVGAESPDSR